MSTFRLVIQDGETYGVTRDRVTLYDSSVIPLSFDQLRKVRAVEYDRLVITLHVYMYMCFAATGRPHH